MRSGYATIRNAQCNNSEDNLFLIRCISLTIRESWQAEHSHTDKNDNSGITANIWTTIHCRSLFHIVNLVSCGMRYKNDNQFRICYDICFVYKFPTGSGFCRYPHPTRTTRNRLFYVNYNHEYTPARYITVDLNPGGRVLDSYLGRGVPPGA